MIGLSVTLEDFPSRLLKYSFHICIYSSWLTAFSFVLKVLFFLLASLTVCHAIRDCLSSTEFLFYFIDLTLNVFFLFFLECVRSVCAILSFCALVNTHTHIYSITNKGTTIIETL